MTRVFAPCVVLLLACGGEVMVDGNRNASTNDASSTSTGGGTSSTSVGGAYGPGPGASPDDAGDVTQPSSDLVAVAVYVGEGLVDVRAQFLEPPFSQVSTASTTFCLDLDENPNSGSSCAMNEGGIESHVGFAQAPGGQPGEFVLSVSQSPRDTCAYASYEATTHTVRAAFPLEVLGDDGSFRYVATSDFGGSGGLNEAVPESGKLDAQQVSTLPPFNGTPACF